MHAANERVTSCEKVFPGIFNLSRRHAEVGRYEPMLGRD